MKRSNKLTYSRAAGKFLGCLALLISAPSIVAVESIAVESMAIENFPDSHAHDHALVGSVETSTNMSEVYACNLIKNIHQCRDYEILDGATSTLTEIKNGCESMQGSFSPQACTKANLLASCRDIIRNYHQPDVIYTNHYYQGASSIWTDALVQEVCQELGGELWLKQ